MVKENISIKFLIHLVGERPALWDKTSEDYKDRKLKETSWREICAFVNENFYSLSNREKAEFCKMIMKKWTHIRDSWVKSMKYGYDEVTKLPPKPYVYHNELKFMQKILKCKPHRFDLNQCQPSNTEFEEFFRETNETQNSHETSQDVGEHEGKENELAVGDFKQESLPAKPALKISEAEISDEWHLEESELPADLEQHNKDEKQELVKKKRSSIFVNSRSQENEHTAGNALNPTPCMPPQIPSILPAAENSHTYRPRSDRHHIEERHWNFFKGILPSINGLDEDHVLQFQSGVISLLQKLRESQKHKQKPTHMSSPSLFKGRGRKRKPSRDRDDDEDWQPLNNHFSHKTSHSHTFDPIAPEYAGPETEYSSDE